MRNGFQWIAVLFVLPLSLSGCGQKPVNGIYQCSGIPGSDLLDLRADGSVQQEGDMLGHHVIGTGTYKEEDGKVTVTITSQTADGAKVSVPKDSGEITFDRDGSDLKWILASCHKTA